MPDNVNHPSHYSKGIEVIDFVESKGWGEGFNRGNAVKYICRAGLKDKNKEIEDLRKAAFYINREIERLQRAGGNVGTQMVEDAVKSFPPYLDYPTKPTTADPFDITRTPNWWTSPGASPITTCNNSQVKSDEKTV